MEISGLSNSLLTNERLKIDNEQHKVNNFQDILNSAVSKGDDAELKKACVEFESYFIQTMFKEMRKTVNIGSTATPKSQTENIFQDMLDEQYSKSTASTGGIGLASMMYKQMKRNAIIEQ